MGNINIDLPDDLHRKLKIEAATSNMTLKELIQAALEKGGRR